MVQSIPLERENKNKNKKNKRGSKIDRTKEEKKITVGHRVYKIE